MSVLTNKEILDKKEINFNKENNEITNNKIKDINNNNEKKREKEKFCFYKKVCVKPFTQRKSNKTENVNISNKIIFIKEKNYIKQLNKNSYNKIKSINNDINSRLGTNLNINDYSMNLVKKNEKYFKNNFSSIAEINKLSEKNNTIDSSNNLIKNSTENNKNTIINEYNKNDLKLEMFDKDKDKVNINYINTISNNVYGKINSPIYLNKIFSLSNTINDNIELFDNINDTDTLNNSKERRINKKLKKKILLNDTNPNIDMNKTNEEIKPNFDYYNSITEMNPGTKIEEIELNSFNNNNNRENKLNKKLNYFENKKKILSSIEREKKKLLEQNYNNYIKYINLIQKQQEQYKEYDQYLKNELRKNRDSQIKLQLYKENYFKIFKNKNIKEIQIGNPNSEFKTLSSHNFSNKNSNYKFKIKRMFPLNKIETNNNKFRLIDKYEPSIITDNSINSIRVSKNGKSTKNNNDKYKRVIKINLDELKRRHTINFIKKTNKKINLHNLIQNNNPSNKNKSNISHLNLNSKQIIPLDRSFNYEFSSKNKILNKDKKNKINIFSDNKNIKTDFREFNKSKKNLMTENEQKSLILKKLVKNIKNEIEKKSDLNKNNLCNTNIQKHIKCNSFKKLEEINEYYYGGNKNKNINKKEIHKLIYEEKKKFLNNFSEKKPYIKINNGIYFSASKPK